MAAVDPAVAGRSVRPARDADSAALIDLIEKIWAEYPGIVLDVDGEEPWLRAPAQAYATTGGELFVAEDAGVPVATIAWRPAGDGVAELKSLYVAAAGRRGGLGSGLVRFIEDRARRAGAERMILWTDTRFADAHRLYERLGYRATGRERELGDRSQTEEYEYEKPLRAPLTDRRPTERRNHGDVFVDDYEWLRDREDPEVIAHLRAENAYAEAVTADQASLRRAIFDEIRSRTEETDLSVPWRRGEWWYYRRTVEGSQYALHCRVPARGDDWTPPVIDPAAPPADEMIMLDENAEADGHAFFSLGASAVSDDGKLLAYAVDVTGNEKFTLRFRDLATGNDLADTIPETFYGTVWAPDSASVTYLVVDETWRPHEVRRHVLGSDPAQDRVIFREDDPTLWTAIDRSADHRTLIISAGNSEVSETRLIDFAELDASDRVEPRVVLPRAAGALYAVEPLDLDGRRELLITHNRDGAENSMVSLLAVDELPLPLAEQHWRTVVPHHDDVRIAVAFPAAGQLCVGLRRDAIPTVAFAPLDGLAGDASVELSSPDFGEQLYSCDVVRASLEAPVVRLGYESFVTPGRVYDYDPAGGELLLRKEIPVRGGYRAEDYLAERVWARAEDGTAIPVTLVRRRDLDPGIPQPTIVYGYGSYEISMDPDFRIPRLSLLDRGVLYAIAHVRGGGELGRRWYTDGKKQHKINSFTDFVAVTRHLVESGRSDPDRIGAMGGSAGGLLMGAVANLAPELYRVIVAQVPFVDALTSILDPELPLSALEWEEWGNPITDAEAYKTIKAYTPYENIRPAAYPRIAAVTSLDDTRVLYVEPAKWVARLREVTTGDEPIVFKIEMDGGHGGGSGRYKGWEDIAWDYAFLLDGLGIR